MNTVRHCLWAFLLVAAAELAFGAPRPGDAQAILEAEYSQYTRAFEAYPPQTFEEFYDAAMNWSPLDSMTARPGRARLRTSRESFAASSTASMHVQIDGIDVQPGRATVLVRKSISGQFVGIRPYQTGWFDARVTARQLWMPVG